MKAYRWALSVSFNAKGRREDKGMKSCVIARNQSRKDEKYHGIIVKIGR